MGPRFVALVFSVASRLWQWLRTEYCSFSPTLPNDLFVNGKFCGSSSFVLPSVQHSAQRGTLAFAPMLDSLVWFVTS